MLQPFQSPHQAQTCHTGDFCLMPSRTPLLPTEGVSLHAHGVGICPFQLPRHCPSTRLKNILLENVHSRISLCLAVDVVWPVVRLSCFPGFPAMMENTMNRNWCSFTGVPVTWDQLNNLQQLWSDLNALSLSFETSAPSCIPEKSMESCKLTWESYKGSEARKVPLLTF